MTPGFAGRKAALQSPSSGAAEQPRRDLPPACPSASSRCARRRAVSAALPPHGWRQASQALGRSGERCRVWWRLQEEGRRALGGDPRIREPGLGRNPENEELSREGGQGPGAERLGESQGEGGSTVVGRPLRYCRLQGPPILGGRTAVPVQIRQVFGGWRAGGVPPTGESWTETGSGCGGLDPLCGCLSLPF